MLWESRRHLLRCGCVVFERQWEKSRERLVWGWGVRAWGGVRGQGKVGATGGSGREETCHTSRWDTKFGSPSCGLPSCRASRRPLKHFGLRAEFLDSSAFLHQLFLKDNQEINQVLKCFLTSWQFKGHINYPQKWPVPLWKPCWTLHDEMFWNIVHFVVFVDVFLILVRLIFFHGLILSCPLFYHHPHLFSLSFLLLSAVVRLILLSFLSHSPPSPPPSLIH